MGKKKLTETEVHEHLGLLPGWSLANDTLHKEFEFASFGKAMEFVNQIAETAEAVQHHPDIDIRYKKVKMATSTHDVGGLSLLDVETAAAADDIAAAIASDRVVTIS